MGRFLKFIEVVADQFKVAGFILAFTAIMLLLAKWAALCYYTALF